jgi:hypothetical protein
MAQVTASEKPIDAQTSLPIATPKGAALSQNKQVRLASQARMETIGNDLGDESGVDQQLTALPEQAGCYTEQGVQMRCHADARTANSAME